VVVEREAAMSDHRTKGAWLVLLLAMVSCGHSRPSPAAPNVQGTMVFGTEKGGLTGWFDGPPKPVTGTVDVVGPFTARQVKQRLGILGGPVRTTLRVDKSGHFAVRLPPGRYLLIGHPPDEAAYTEESFYQQREIVVPPRGVLKVRLLLDLYLP
jgi:hypothetical protein